MSRSPSPTLGNITVPEPTLTDIATQASAPFLAFKPIVWFVVFIATGVLFGSNLMQRVTALEEGMYILVSMECKRNPQDSLCSARDRQ